MNASDSEAGDPRSDQILVEKQEISRKIIRSQKKQVAQWGLTDRLTESAGNFFSGHFDEIFVIFLQILTRLRIVKKNPCFWSESPEIENYLYSQL